MKSSDRKSFNSGSRWHRWEPHVHAPGTVLNDQFGGDDPWEDYLTALEKADPEIRAIGVTDYYSTDTYESVCQAKREGRLSRCELIFPNIEMRLGIGTLQGRWVNIHLLVSPDDPDHVVELKRFLNRLSFRVHDDSFQCSRDDLIRLGKRCDPSITAELAALRRGSEQFKVSLDQLREFYRESTWAQENILVAVAGSATDGSSGVREGADATLRQEIEKFAHVIFASSPSQREFWLGRKALGEGELRRRYGGLKPCLHGSDAHDQRSVGLPDGDRYSWVKGALCFDALKQACIDPAGRAFVGAEPPVSATPSQVISSVEISGAPWAQTSTLALNPGLIAIIGARGSGKTALADMIAAGCDALPEQLPSTSFLMRARELLGKASVELQWESGESSERALDGSDSSFSAQYPRARYLSQQFVEELCSADGVTDALLREIERVIFEAHPLSARDGAIDFQELLEIKAARHRQSRMREERALADLSDRIGTEIEKNKLAPVLTAQVAEKAQLIERYTADRAKLVARGSQERVVRLGALMAAADKVRGYLRFFSAREQALLALKDEVVDVRNNRAPEALRRTKEEHASSGLKEEDWTPFLLDYKGDVDATLTKHLASVRSSAASWKGVIAESAINPEAPMIASDAVLDQIPLATLEAEIVRLEKLVSVDREVSSKFSAISKRIAEEISMLERLKEKLKDCEQAKDRIIQLAKERDAAYVRVFESILAEQAVLTELYEPLVTRLTAAEGTLKRLSFSVARTVDVEGWASRGEDLLDLRRLGPFRGRGTLQQRAEAVLKAAWESGDAQTVTAAMETFRSKNQEGLLEHSPVPKADQADYRAWLKRFAQWLYSTDHITIRYSIDYDGVDIRKLSPGTRGIILLLLYLALDDTDDRPLIIDQPEENLDPKSVFDELVALFVEAKSKRQVIMVTHNANLVINTDADQIIVARCGPHLPGELPPITYESGGLENGDIRKAVCDILEGGEHAFRERARRLRVRLER